MSFRSSPGAPKSPSAPVPASPAASPAIRIAAARLIQAVRTSASSHRLAADPYGEVLAALGEHRGQPLAHPLLASGSGQGASVILADGRSVLDMVSGIGPYVFGHDDRDLLETATIAAATDVAFQGHVLPGLEYARLLDRLLRLSGPRLVQGWLALSGSMANENALKLILQRRAPADQVVVFEGAFHGRTLAMAELTDRPEYREGLPLRGGVHRIPFYDPDDPDSTARTLGALDSILSQQPGRIAAFCFELVQGEGGFNVAPREFFEALMRRCQEASVAVWIDEIQTFARTGELFAFQTLGLDEFVDVVTAGKILQGSVTLFTADYRPRPKLIAGTWAGSTVGMALGERILERLEKGGFFGPNGRVARLAARIDAHFDALEARTARRLPGAIGRRSGLGAMQAFVPFDGRAETVGRVVELCLEEGVLFQPAGRQPMKIRLLPPLNIEEAELASAFAALERALGRFAKEREGGAARAR